ALREHLGAGDVKRRILGRFRQRGVEDRERLVGPAAKRRELSACEVVAGRAGAETRGAIERLLGVVERAERELDSSAQHPIVDALPQRAGKPIEERERLLRATELQRGLGADESRVRLPGAEA